MVCLMIWSLHHLVLMYMHSPPPIDFPVACCSLSSLNGVPKPGRERLSSFTVRFNQVSLKHNRQLSLYIYRYCVEAWSSSNLFLSDLTLERTTVGSGGLDPLARMQTLIPPLEPLFLFVLTRRCSVWCRHSKGKSVGGVRCSWVVRPSWSSWCLP